MLTIAWDVDDVLNGLTRAWFEKEWLAVHPHCALRYENLKENPPQRILGVTLLEYLESLDHFRLSEKYRDMKPVPEVADWFKKYGAGFRHLALTAVPFKASARSAFWVLDNFGMWIRTFHFIPSQRQGEELPGPDKNKSDYLAWLNKVDIIIDDNEENIRGAVKLGIRGILIPRPWNNAKGTVSQALKI